MTVVINGRFVTSSFGGAQRFAVELTERLSRLRGDVLLVTPPLPAHVELPDAPHRVIGRADGPMWEQLELPRWLRREQGRPLLINPATIAPIAYTHQITVVHDIAPALRPQDFSRLFRMQWRASMRWGTLRRGQRLVTISEQSRREISDLFHVAPDRIDLVYAGAGGFPGVEPAERSRPSGSSFLVFGRHGAAKNVRTVIDAASRLPASSIDLRLVGKLDPALQPYAVERGVPADRLVWLGPVSDGQLVQQYQQAVGFIWPSLHEGFGIPPLEAQSLGLPVIASDIPINREVLGDSAIFFPASDPDALASAMTALASDPALHARLRERGIENAKRFTWDKTAAGWNDLIMRDAE